jgi:hypothetical protein
VKTRTKHPDDIPVGLFPAGVAVTPNGKTAFITNAGRGVGSGGDTVSTIDVKTRTKHPIDIPIGIAPSGCGHAVLPVTGSTTEFRMRAHRLRYHSATERRPWSAAAQTCRYTLVNPVQNDAPERRAGQASART